MFPWCSVCSMYAVRVPVRTVRVHSSRGSASLCRISVSRPDKFSYPLLSHLRRIVLHSPPNRQYLCRRHRRRSTTSQVQRNHLQRSCRNRQRHLRPLQGSNRRRTALAGSPEHHRGRQRPLQLAARRAQRLGHPPGIFQQLMRRAGSAPSPRASPSNRASCSSAYPTRSKPRTRKPSAACPPRPSCAQTL